MPPAGGCSCCLQPAPAPPAQPYLPSARNCARRLRAAAPTALLAAGQHAHHERGGRQAGRAARCVLLQPQRAGGVVAGPRGSLAWRMGNARRAPAGAGTPLHPASRRRAAPFPLGPSLNPSPPPQTPTPAKRVVTNLSQCGNTSNLLTSLINLTCLFYPCRARGDQPEPVWQHKRGLHPARTGRGGAARRHQAGRGEWPRLPCRDAAPRCGAACQAARLHPAAGCAELLYAPS